MAPQTTAATKLIAMTRTGGVRRGPLVRKAMLENAFDLKLLEEAHDQRHPAERGYRLVCELDLDLACAPLLARI